MANIRITIDGTTVMDADPGTWSSTPPDIDAVRAKGENQTWMMAIMAALAKAATLAMAGQPQSNTTITVATRKDGWTLDVQE